MKKALALGLMLVGMHSALTAQIPVEIFGGNRNMTLDIMFFKYFKNKDGDRSKILFFNRNRASVDYRMGEGDFLPTMGFTEAVSYNHPKLKGFAPVAVGQVLSWGVFPKAGIQYAHVSKRLTIFSWFVTETLRNPELDYFILLRYTPRLTEKASLYTQLESLNVFPSSGDENLRFVQRGRLGLALGDWQFGLGGDFSQSGRREYSSTSNVGAFLRHEF